MGWVGGWAPGKVTGDSSQEGGWWGEVGGWVGAGKEEEEQKGFLGF